MADSHVAARSFSAGSLGSGRQGGVSSIRGVQGQTERCGPPGAAGTGAAGRARRCRLRCSDQGRSKAYTVCRYCRVCRSLHAFWRQILPLLLRILRLQASVLHAAAALLRRPPNEAAAMELLIQAAEAAVRGALQFKSAQLLVGALVMYLFPANPG